MDELIKTLVLLAVGTVVIIAGAGVMAIKERDAEYIRIALKPLLLLDALTASFLLFALLINGKG